MHAALVVASEPLGAVVATSEAHPEDCERDLGSSARNGSVIDGSGPRRPGGGATVSLTLGRHVFSGVIGGMSAAPRPAGANFSALRLGVTCAGARGAESGGGKADLPVAGERGSESSDGNEKDPGRTFGPAYSGHRVSFGAGVGCAGVGCAGGGFVSRASSVSGFVGAICANAGFAIGVPVALGVSAAAVGVAVALGVPVGLVVIGAGLNPGFFSDGDSQDSIARAMADGLVTFLQGWKVRT